MSSILVVCSNPWCLVPRKPPSRSSCHTALQLPPLCLPAFPFPLGRKGNQFTFSHAVQNRAQGLPEGRNQREENCVCLWLRLAGIPKVPGSALSVSVCKLHCLSCQVQKKCSSPSPSSWWWWRWGQSSGCSGNSSDASQLIWRTVGVSWSTSSVFFL